MDIETAKVIVFFVVASLLVLLCLYALYLLTDLRICERRELIASTEAARLQSERLRKIDEALSESQGIDNRRTVLESIWRLSPFDEIVVSGRAVWPTGLELCKVRATVAVVDRDEPQSVKLWPVAEDVGDGKVWILFNDITELEIVQRDCE